MSIKSITIGFLCCIFVTVLSGCSWITDFYIQNLTGSKKIIKINYSYPISKAIDNKGGNFAFNYENGILSPRSFYKIKNPKSLEKIEVKDSSIVLELYPNSTTKIYKSHNGSWRYRIKSVEINGTIFYPSELINKSRYISKDYVYKIE
ncbi:MULTISPECIES: hypothetical protein [unclassified Chryseobacterium]|uniref:hypothetical protein n=1 Tax=unclassified Chryseobacterium TaxID=2593645 RepID=UPI000D711AAC|nr:MULTISPECIES: hypothetical protein [unclassified Chryseobacterium]PWW19068.1 hypothetical protein DEU40_12122 [Chryseobacterium sp. AG844]